MNESSQLIEIIFKDVSIEKIPGLLQELTSSGAAVSNYHCTCECPKIDWNDKQSIEAMLHKETQFGLFINLNELLIENTCMPHCGIVIYKDGTSIQLELNFALSDMKIGKSHTLTNSLMKMGKHIAKTYQIQEYFCGIEPAEDQETRLFTNEKLGPLHIEGDTSSLA